MVECPYCFQLYPIENIADHADLCIDDWVGEVDLPMQADSAQESDTEALHALEHRGDDVSLNEVLLKLIEDHVNKEGEARAIRVRRKCLWEDFKEARSKGKLSLTVQFRIIFIGEPAIDDGGPKREFLSGMYVSL